MCELLIVELLETKKLIVLLYRPPDCSKEKFNEICQKVKNTFEANEDHSKVMCGDFNFPRKIVEWKSTEAGMISCLTSGRGEGNVQEQRAAFKIINTIGSDNFMGQIVQENTRANNILDLIYTDEFESIEMCTVRDIPTISDHKTIITKVTWGGN